MNDDFVDVKGYEGLYKINKEGDVWSCKRKRLLKISINNGYKSIVLSKNNTINNLRFLLHLAHGFTNNDPNVAPTG